MSYNIPLRCKQKFQVADVDVTSKIVSLLLKRLIELKMNDTTVKLKAVLVTYDYVTFLT